MKNLVGVELPDYIDGYGKVMPYNGAFNNELIKNRREMPSKMVKPGENKVLDSIDEAFEKIGLKDGMVLSFHHHLRNGDYVMNMVLKRAAERGVKDLTIAASSIFPIHAPLVEHIKNGVVSKIIASYISGPVAHAVSKGILKNPVIMQTHGGRARAIESGEVKIDAAFVAAPTADTYGNINGVQGKSACGVLGYAVADCMYSDNVIAVTDNLIPYPACPIEIPQVYVDYVVKVESIGNPSGIVSGTTKITKDPIGLKIARDAAKLIKKSGLLKDGMSFQTGAGGTSLAVAKEVKEMMIKDNIKGSFASGGITGYLVEMLKEGLFESILDVQCFDIDAVNSFASNSNHQGMSASMYGNPHNKGAVVNNLDIVILGATEIDTNFNVNVTTGSDGVIMGGSGGHSDTAAGSKLTIIVSNLMKARLPIIKDKIMTITTPGETVDALVTERGIAINPKRQDILEKLKDSGLKILTIEELKEIAEKFTGKPKEIEQEDKIVAVVEYRDGSVIDVIRKVK
ncbi:citrate lyase subunit alpha [Clostridium polynesiense]|uniref:citrate lyase subunit alpha n=1 Tax=Clostridium polynesiense TaxID=1325933 RepID=UPI00058B0B03|nr:citrate lyase subunit alpha [Clostridium polynesiense]